MGRFVRDFIQTSIIRTSYMFSFLAIPLLLVAGPQRGAENSAASASSQQTANREAAVTNFPQLPYQGTPPELPQDQGVVGLQQTLRRLGTTAHLMQTVAHPDDEDGGMLTLESRGRGASGLLVTLNGGEGGENKV